MNLTRRSYALAVAIVVLGVLGEWGPDSWHGAWRLPAAAVILVLVLEGLLVRRRALHLERQLPPKARLGRAETGALVLRNPSPYPLALEMLDPAPAGAEVTADLRHWQLGPHGDARQPLRFTPLRLGAVEWTTAHTRLKGQFGLAWWSRRIALPGTVQVIPDRLDATARRNTGTRAHGQVARRATGTGRDLLGLREYQRGDPLHAIDWKATARSGRTTVRLFSDEQRTELVILLDAGRASALQAGRLTRCGHYVNVAARLAEKSLLYGDRLSLVVFADEVLAVQTDLRGQAGVQRLRATLTDLRPVARDTSALPAILRTRQLARQRSLVVVLTDLDDRDGAAQLVQALGLLQPKHLPLLAAITDEEVVALQHQGAAHWLDPYDTLAAHEIGDTWRRTRQHLARFGVPVVLAPADRLDEQVLSCYDTLKDRRRV